MITDILQEMKISHRWSERTYIQYKSIMQGYCAFHKTTFEELLREAEEEEEQIRKINKRRIKQRLLQYKLHLVEQNKSENTVHNYITKIKHCYIYQDIEIPSLPRSSRKEKKESFADLPTQDMIREAITHSNTKMKAIITSLASSGLRRSDLVSLTVRDFCVATRDAHRCDVISDETFPEIISRLQGRDDVVAMFEIVSRKTGVAHLSFFSMEACSFVVQMLRERLLKRGVRMDERLFGVCEVTVTTNFERLNDRLGFGWKERRRRFHPHALRSWFATTLTSHDVDYLTTEFLLGHSLPAVQSSYYYANPEKLRLKYMRVVDELCFVTRVHHVDLVREEHRELERLRAENKATREKLHEIEELMNMLRKAGV